jgi:hypothetical protein
MSAWFEIPGLNIYNQLAVTVVSIAATLLATRGRRRESVAEIVATFTIGLSGWFTMMSGLMGHLLFADEVAAGIGWPLDSGFQMELGFASIGIGLVGFASFWNRLYQLPFIAMKWIFGWGAGYTHILHQLRHANFSASNTGLIVYWDFLFPLVMVALYVLARRASAALPTRAT